MLLPLELILLLLFGEFKLNFGINGDDDVAGGCGINGGFSDDVDDEDGDVK